MAGLSESDPGRLAPGVETVPLHDPRQVGHCHGSRDIEMLLRDNSRDRHALVSVGGNLYAVGGSRSIGSERSIEMFDGTQWQEIARTNGFR